MKKLLLTAVTLVALAAPAMAVDLQGKYGLGYFRPEFPVGGRVWFSDQLGLDAGIGFLNFSPDQGDGQTAWGIDIGVPFVVTNTDNALFFVRPGVNIQDDGGDEDTSVGKETSFGVSGSLGVEYFFTPNFSIQAAHGIAWQSITTKADPDDDPTTPNSIDATDSFLGTEAFGISNIGFHWYFGGK
jgi:opacity protein-like surface antigen